MDDLIFWIQQHRAVTLLSMAGISLGAACLTGHWARQGLRNGVTRFGGNLIWLEPTRSEMPVLYWLSITAQISLSGAFGLFGIAMLVWCLSLIL
jgi:hypothetical protein